MRKDDGEMTKIQKWVKESDICLSQNEDCAGHILMTLEDVPYDLPRITMGINGAPGMITGMVGDLLEEYASKFNTTPQALLVLIYIRLMETGAITDDGKAQVYAFASEALKGDEWKGKLEEAIEEAEAKNFKADSPRLQ